MPLQALSTFQLISAVVEQQNPDPKPLYVLIDTRGSQMCLQARDLRIVFFVRIESRIESAVYTTQAVTRPDGPQAFRIMLTTSIVNERELCTELSTCSFQFSPKTRQTMPLG